MAGKTQATSYPIPYLVENAHLFKAPPEVIEAVLSGKESATKKEAEDAIEKYLKQPKETQKEANE